MSMKSGSRLYCNTLQQNFMGRLPERIPQIRYPLGFHEQVKVPHPICPTPQ